jgi:hypothetical protein
MDARWCLHLSCCPVWATRVHTPTS